VATSERGARLALAHTANLDHAGEAAVPLEGRDDDDLMLLARGGANRAFAALVRRHQTRVLRVAGRMLDRRPQTAADVVQNTFLEIYRVLPRYQPRGQFRSYLFRVLLNQCRMAQRAARTEARNRPVAEPPTEAPHEAQLLQRERERNVEAALGRLSPKLRDVVLLRYSGDLSYDEVATTLAVPLGTVKRRLFDAMKQLRELMEEP